ncbi:MAG: methylenetetrahydrofolate reductase [NAD(P)H] [Chloroflexi bacterium]|nr:methylenetetrahydrofolate reductase [NAD(P)H] [Chloroflexota bacterium]
MKIADALICTFPSFSFEFFSPKSDEQMAQLLETIGKLRRLEPLYVSVTYGAGGSTRARTIEVVTRIKREFGIEAMAHLTCVGASQHELREVLDRLASDGVKNIMALRGDPPRGAKDFRPAPDGFAHASELIAFIRANYDLSIGGACYPEGHFEGATGRRADLDEDVRHLVTKVNAGAQFLVTQLFYENERYLSFVERARAAGIRVPIIPGIMPIVNVDSIPRIAKMSGSNIPASLIHELERRVGNPEAVVELGVAYATLQCAELLRLGAPGIHFYTLNRSPATSAILSALKIMEPWRGVKRET